MADPAHVNPVPCPAVRQCAPAEPRTGPGGVLAAASPSAPARRASTAGQRGPAPLPSVPESAELPLQEPLGAAPQAPSGLAGVAEAGQDPGTAARGGSSGLGSGLEDAVRQDGGGYSFPALLSCEGGCPSPDPIPNPALGPTSARAQPQPGEAAEAAPHRITRSAGHETSVGGHVAVGLPSRAAASHTSLPSPLAAAQGTADAAQLPQSGTAAERGPAIGRATRSSEGGAGPRPASATGACGVDAAWGAVGGLLEHIQPVSAQDGAPAAAPPAGGPPDPHQGLSAPAAAGGSPAPETERAWVGRPRVPRSDMRASVSQRRSTRSLGGGGDGGSASPPQDGHPESAEPAAAERARKKSSGSHALRELETLAPGLPPGLLGACVDARVTRQSSRAGAATGALPAFGPAMAAVQPLHGRGGKEKPLPRRSAVALVAGKAGAATEVGSRPAAPVTRKRARSAAAATGLTASPKACAVSAASPAEGGAAKRARHGQGRGAGSWLGSRPARDPAAGARGLRDRQPLGLGKMGGVTGDEAGPGLRSGAGRASAPLAARMRLRSAALDNAAELRQQRLLALQASSTSHSCALYMINFHGHLAYAQQLLIRYMWVDDRQSADNCWGPAVYGSKLAELLVLQERRQSMPAQHAPNQTRPVPAPAAASAPRPQPHGSEQPQLDQEMRWAQKRTPLPNKPALVPRLRTWSASLPDAAEMHGPTRAALRPAAASAAETATASVRPAARSTPARPAAPAHAAPLPVLHIGIGLRSGRTTGAPEGLRTQLCNAERAAAETRRSASPTLHRMRAAAADAAAGICAQVDGGPALPGVRMVRLQCIKHVMCSIHASLSWDTRLYFVSSYSLVW